ncbi:DUF3558 domain-containing protein [Streptomyces sp. SCSIO ZS0520]|uniref:DUF3558 domain-containing protein n=1 Tax=Streptomyces sp. SCSIO ZS0520 TaxID=2892996 RepID=UPI0021DB6246|nr:DUF3558 domain-containing protein [Streptomyces sp. SCSIO ZS0520]
MHRSAQRLSRLLAVAAVPVILVASGCSSDDSGSDEDKKGSATPSASPSVAKARFADLPDPCEVFEKKTLKDLVPETDDESGKAGKSEDNATRGTCAWTSLDNKGVKGSQFRWLNVSLLRFDSDQSRGTGDKLAHAYFQKQVAGAEATQEAKGVKTQPVAGTGDEASAVSYELKKKEGTFKQQTVVARTANVVVTVDYNGAGLAGDKSPSAEDLVKDAQAAAKEAVAAVEKANSGADAGSGADSGSGEKSDKDEKDEKSDKGEKGDSGKKS